MLLPWILLLDIIFAHCFKQFISLEDFSLSRYLFDDYMRWAEWGGGGGVVIILWRAALNPRMLLGVSILPSFDRTSA